jgi:hypothetical protein
VKLTFLLKEGSLQGGKAAGKRGLSHFGRRANIRIVMLCFTDESLARLCIACTRMRPFERGPWLERLARRIEGAPAPNRTRAERQRAYRNRQRNGRAYVRFQIDVEKVAAALATFGGPVSADPAALASELENFVDQWADDQLKRYG